MEVFGTVILIKLSPPPPPPRVVSSAHPSAFHVLFVAYDPPPPTVYAARYLQFRSAAAHFKDLSRYPISSATLVSLFFYSCVFPELLRGPS